MHTTSSLYYPLRLFLVRSFYEWIVKNQWTPLVVADIQNDPHLEALRPYSKNHKITLDIADDAVDGLSFDEDGLRATCYFDEQPHNVFVPLSAIISIAAAENGRGVDFDTDEEQEDIVFYLEQLKKNQNPSPKTAHLKIIRHQPTEVTDES